MSDSARLYRGSLSPDEAVAKLGALVTQIDEIETVTLADAAGRVLAADLLAAQDLPATNNAAVDGYGVDAAFLAANPSHAFPVTGRAAAGHQSSGCCRRSRSDLYRRGDAGRGRCRRHA